MKRAWLERSRITATLIIASLARDARFFQLSVKYSN